MSLERLANALGYTTICLFVVPGACFLTLWTTFPANGTPFLVTGFTGLALAVLCWIGEIIIRRKVRQGRQNRANQ